MNAIWDADGTLLDSYEIICKVLHEVLKRHGVTVSLNDIYIRVTDTSVSNFIEDQSKNMEIDFSCLKKEYSKLLKENNLNIKLMPYTKEVLQKIKMNNGENFIFTHKSDSIYEILDLYKITHLFTEVLTSNNNFERKPNPHALNYLVKKHNLDRAQTYYIGDRSLDIEVAKNAKIHSIFYNSNNLEIHDADITVNSLHELSKLKII